MYIREGCGGGLAVYRQSVVRLVNMEINGNNASFNGGGICILGGDFTKDTSRMQVSNNVALNAGGGGLFHYPELGLLRTFFPSTSRVDISDNQAWYGGQWATQPTVWQVTTPSSVDTATDFSLLTTVSGKLLPLVQVCPSFRDLCLWPLMPADLL
jgi:hypothetical protein